MSRGGLEAGPVAPQSPGQEFLISELLAFIPPAISAQSGIPMSREVRIPLPADGSRDVKLSTIYQICPELFAAEITPLNDSTLTLPPKLGAMMGSGSADGAGAEKTDSPMGFSPAADKPSAGFGAAPATPPPGASNPFWSPAPAAEAKPAPAIPSDMKDETTRPRQDDAPAWPKEASGGLNPFAAHAPAAQVPAKGNAFAAPAAPAAEAKIPAGFDAPAAVPAAGESAFSGESNAGPAGGFAGFESKPSSVLFGGGAAAVTNEADDKGGKVFPGNPFESEKGFNTLFSKQAEVDMDIPFPTGPAPAPAARSAETSDEPQGVWGAMFHGGGFPETDGAVAGDDSFSPPTFESIGNLLKQGTGPAEAPAPAGFQSATEPAAPPASDPAPMTPINAIPTGFSAFEAAPEIKEPAPAPAPVAKAPEPAPKEEMPPATGFPAFTAPAQGFAGFGSDTVPTPSPIDAFANGAPFESPAPAPAAFEAPAPAAVFEAPPAPAPVVEAIPVSAPAPAPAPARATAPATGEASFDMRDLELRAIFSTSENFTLSMVARRVVGLPGIVSCSLSTPGKLVQASKSEEGRIGNEAREMVATLRSLAKLTGLPEARNFTLHTDRGIVSLFLEGECCVMVHHEAAAFEPGVREKLILVARSLINLEE